MWICCSRCETWLKVLNGTQGVKYGSRCVFPLKAWNIAQGVKCHSREKFPFKVWNNISSVKHYWRYERPLIVKVWLTVSVNHKCSSSHSHVVDTSCQYKSHNWKAGVGVWKLSYRPFWFCQIGHIAYQNVGNWKCLKIDNFIF